jgi:thiol-disulfide isomerase/thioredoxin
MLSTLRKDDCGCGGGKHNCISKKAMQKWVIAELKRLDCGCGCKGEKAFKKKYGSLVGGKILKDCPPGWRNDGLTCVSQCQPDEHDDPLSCRKKCAPGQIDDGLTCRNPIQSSMNSCPDGSRDIAGTCWGPVRQDCVHDCFKHPAPGCRTYECGRLKGLFGEDWGPRLCTDCDLNCGKTCWNVDGITKQLHERELRVWGGEVNAQAIRFKTVEGRVDFAELGSAMKAGLEDLFSADGALAKLFDPEKNGVAAAMRKFGDDMKAILEEVGSRIKDGFEKMGAAAKAAFEEMARNAERDFKAFGDEFVKMMKDPMFWAEVVGVLAMVAGAALSMALATVTLGIGAPAAVGLMAACAMAGPAAKMIAKASTGQPIDALDIANLAISGASAMVPGLSGMVQTAVKVGTTAASVVISGVQAAQALQIIPSTCIANCPAPIPDIEVPKLDDPKFPRDPPPAGQKTDEEILDTVVPRSRFIFSLRDPRRENPDYIGMTELEYIAKYRRENYNADGTPIAPGNQIVSPEDKAIEAATEVVLPDEPPLDAGDLETPNPVEGEFDELPGFEEMPSDGFDELPGFEEMPSDGFDELPGFEPMPGPDDVQEVTIPETPKASAPPFDNFKTYVPGDLAVTPDGQTWKMVTYIGAAGYYPSAPDWEKVPSGGRRGGAEFQVVDQGESLSNFWGSDQMKAVSRPPPDDPYGEPFNADCYGRNYPDLQKNLGDSKKLTEWWIDKGHKNGDDPSCNNFMPESFLKDEYQKCAAINQHAFECRFDINIPGGVECKTLPNNPCYKYLNKSTWIDDVKRNPEEAKKRKEKREKDEQALRDYIAEQERRKLEKPELIRLTEEAQKAQEEKAKRDQQALSDYVAEQERQRQQFIQRASTNPFGFGKPGKSLTLYHADWCHFCTKLMPIWKKLGSEYKGIKIVTNEEKQNKSFPVDGYPTIVYRDGKTMEKYEGKRTKAAIVNFLKSKL